MVEGGEAKDGGHFLQVMLAKIVSVVNCVQTCVLVINDAASRNGKIFFAQFERKDIQLT